MYLQIKILKKLILLLLRQMPKSQWKDLTERSLLSDRFRTESIKRMNLLTLQLKARHLYIRAESDLTMKLRKQLQKKELDIRFIHSL